MPPTVLPTSSVKTLRTVLTLSSRSLCSDTDIEECVTASEEKRQSQPPAKKRKISLFPESDEDCGFDAFDIKSAPLSQAATSMRPPVREEAEAWLHRDSTEGMAEAGITEATVQDPRSILLFARGGKAGSLIWPSGLAWSLPFPQAVLGLNVCGIMPS